MMTLQQLTQEHGLLFQKFKGAKRKCLEPGCEILAINSHILQKNGVLTHIQQDNHIYKLNTDQITGNLSFKRTGVNNAFSFKGFCNYQDTSIFSLIEQKSFDINNYKNKLLLCYRGILNEQRKKEVLVDVHLGLILSQKVRMRWSGKPGENKVVSTRCKLV